MRIALCLMAILAASTNFVAAQATRDRNAPGGAGQLGGGYGSGLETQGADSRWLNPGGNNSWRPPSYQLGVTVRNTDRGVVLTSVLPGSNAQRAGLERNDTILTVAGYQVGYVGRQLYDLGDEINARAANGQALLLIQNGRNGELRNLTVDLATTRGVVSGAARWGTDVSLSRDAMLVVRIIDVTNPAWQDVVVAEQIYRGVSRGGAQYEIGYAPANIQANRKYAIAAHIRDGNTVPFELATPRNVTLNGSNQRLDVTLDRSRGQGGGNRPGAFPTLQIVSLYQSLLDRPPTAREIALWQAEFARGSTLDDVRRQLLGGTEYYDKNRNDDNRFLNDVYGSTQGRAPDAAELDRMKQQLQSSGGLRTDLVRDLMKRLEGNQPPK